jgi:hypothetical protein
MEMALGALTVAMAEGGHEPRVSIHHLRERYIRARCVLCGLQAEARYSAGVSDQVVGVLGPATANDCARGRCAFPC